MDAKEFENDYMIQIPILLLTYKELIISKIAEKFGVKSRGGITSTVDVLENMKLVKTHKDATGRYCSLTEKGEEIAEKLSLVFDESVKAFPIPNEQVKKLKKACEFKEIKAQGIKTWEDFIKRAIEEKYSEFASTKLLVD